MDKNLLVAYDPDTDTSVFAGFVVRNNEDRKNLTQELIDEDKITFKKFIEVLQSDYERKITEYPPEELLRINIDKFLDEDIVEFI
jgi:hypothetical protein